MSRLHNALAAFLLLSSPILAAIPASAQDQGDPPADVARIAVISGSVSYHQPGSQAQGSPEWEQAQQNYPLAPGSGVWTEPRSHAAVDVAGARIHLDGSSQLEVTAINQGQVQLAVGQGAAYVHVYPGVSGVNFEIDTAHGAAHISQPGQYEIVAGDDQHPASVSVIEGQAQFVGQSANLVLQPGQRGDIAPDNTASTGAVQPDDFVRSVQADEQPYQQQVAQTAQYVSPQQTGYQDLARYGQWSQAPQYGAVWYPQQVASGWAPYRYGHWAYVAPWGYTWVDDAPWGFTPFHYGRWVQISGRWGWLPGERVVHPVYAPALVSFFGNLGGGVGIDVSVGWVPLGPQEVYVPYYRHSDRYVREVNVTNVRNQTTIINVVNKKTVINYNNYVNYRGATSVSRNVMAGGRAVGPAYGKHDNKQFDQQWAHAKPEQEVTFKPQYNGNQKPANGPKFSQQNQSKQNGQPKWQQNNQPQAKQGGQPKWQQSNQPEAKPSNQPKWQPNGQAQAKPSNQTPSNKTRDWNKSEPGQANGQKTWGPKNNNGNTNAKPKNGAPTPYVPPVNGAAQKPDVSKQGSIPAAAANAPAAPKPSKAAYVPQWSSNQKVDKKKQQQQIQQEQASKKAQWKKQQQQQSSGQQWKQQQSKQQQLKQQQNNAKAPKGNQPQTQPQQKPAQNCQPGAVCQQ